jgi:hypothetical protein
MSRGRYRMKLSGKKVFNGGDGGEGPNLEPPSIANAI